MFGDVMAYNKTNDIVKVKEKNQLADKKSMLYEIFNKRDSLTKVYNKCAVISLNDIYDLKDRVLEKLSIHQNQNVTSVSVGLSGGKNLNFGVWKEFELHEWRENQYIKHINIVFESLIQIPGQELPEKHTLVVKLTSGINPGELLNLIFTGKIEDVDEFEINAATIVARVDFINQVLGDELISIVDNWVKSLSAESLKNNKYILFFRKFRKYVAYFINYVPVYMISIVAILYMDKIHEIIIKDDVSLGNVKFIIILYLAFYTLNAFFKFLAKYTFNKLEDYRMPFVFDITRGDKKEKNKIINENRAGGIKGLISIIFNILINIICGIITAKYF